MSITSSYFSFDPKDKHCFHPPLLQWSNDFSHINCGPDLEYKRRVRFTNRHQFVWYSRSKLNKTQIKMFKLVRVHQCAIQYCASIWFVSYLIVTNSILLFRLRLLCSPSSHWPPPSQASSLQPVSLLHFHSFFVTISRRVNNRSNLFVHSLNVRCRSIGHFIRCTK